MSPDRTTQTGCQHPISGDGAGAVHAMKSMRMALAIVAMVCTGFATLMARVCCMAGGAISTPAQFRAFELWKFGLTLLGGAG